MLKAQSPFFIRKEKTGEIPIFGTFFSKNKTKQKINLTYISLKIRSTMFYYVIVKLYVEQFSWFWYQWKEETLSYIMVSNNFTLGMPISSSQGVVTTPLRKTCYKKKGGSGWRGLRDDWLLTNLLKNSIPWNSLIKIPLCALEVIHFVFIFCSKRVINLSNSFKWGS